MIQWKKWAWSYLLFVNMHATYGAITGGVAIPLPAISEPVIFPSVAFPPSVIFPPCANAGAIIDIPSTDATVTAPKVVIATNIVARIFVFIFESIEGVELQTI